MFNFFKEYGWYVAAGVVLGVGIIVAGPAVATAMVEAGKSVGSGVKRLAEGTLKVPGGLVDAECFCELFDEKAEIFRNGKKQF